MLLDTVTRRKSREGFVFTNILPKVSRIELKHINSDQYEQITGPSHSEGKEIQAWRKRRGRNYRDGSTITTLALPASLPLHLLLLCPFCFSLCYSVCSPLPISLYAIDGKPLIRTRAFALVLEAEVEQGYLLSSFFPQRVPGASVEFQIVIQ